MKPCSMFKRFAICVSAYLTVGVMSLPLSVVIATTQTLENYYVYFRAPGVSSYSLRSISSDFPPAVVSDGFDPGHDIISAGLFLTINRFIDHDISSDYPCFNGSGLEVPYMVTDDTFTFNAPTRQRTWDGGQYDASAMVNLHNGQPWATYFWGYRLGLVPSQADWNPLNLANAPGLYPWISRPD